MSYFLVIHRQGSPQWFRTQAAARAECLRTPGARLLELPTDLSLLRFLVSPLSGLNDGDDWDDAEQERGRPSSAIDQHLFIAAIELDDFVQVSRLVNRMPDLLINSMGHPSQYRDQRLNALHMAAKAGAWQTAELILCLVNTPSYVKQHGPPELSSLLLDYYLNMPEPSERNTPLHLAVRCGAKMLVQVLVSYPQCEYKPNARGHYPLDLLGDEETDAQPNAAETHREIGELLREGYFVALARTEGDIEPPTVVGPFSRRTVPALLPVGGKLRFNVTMTAFAGPMTEAEAHAFYKEWKRSPHLTPVSHTHYRCSVTGQLHDDRHRKQSVAYGELSYRRTYLMFGMERVGRSLARSKGIEWKEYWPFLANYCNVSEGIGLQKLERYLALRDVVCREHPDHDPVTIGGDLKDEQNWRALTALNSVQYDATEYPHVSRWHSRMREFVRFLLDGALGQDGVRTALSSMNIGRITG